MVLVTVRTRISQRPLLTSAFTTASRASARTSVDRDFLGPPYNTNGMPVDKGNWDLLANYWPT